MSATKEETTTTTGFSLRPIFLATIRASW